jgi:sugar O-acyltransferase (sialic acid O-acetyltransferase NeuD family)
VSDAELVIVGDGEFAEIAYEYFTEDSPYDVAGFSVERDYLEKDELFGLPVVPFEQLEELYDPARYRVYVAVTYTQLNRVRARLLRGAKEKGYTPVSYISSNAFVWRNAEIGENCFVFENNVIQYHVEIGDNVVLWSGNHVGHRTRIGANTFVSSHVVISGYCDIGESCFLGVNSCVGDFRKIGKDCIVGAGTVVIRDLEPGQVYVGNPARPVGDSYTSFKVPGDAR